MQGLIPLELLHPPGVEKFTGRPAFREVNLQNGKDAVLSHNTHRQFGTFDVLLNQGFLAVLL